MTAPFLCCLQLPLCVCSNGSSLFPFTLKQNPFMKQRTVHILWTARANPNPWIFKPDLVFLPCHHHSLWLFVSIYQTFDTTYTLDRFLFNVYLHFYRFFRFSASSTCPLLALFISFFVPSPWKIRCHINQAVFCALIQLHWVHQSNNSQCYQEITNCITTTGSSTYPSCVTNRFNLVLITPDLCSDPASRPCWWLSHVAQCFGCNNLLCCWH